MKEVEINNTIEVQANKQTNSGVVEAYLTELGTILNVSVKGTLATNERRFIWVDKMVTDTKLNKYTPIRLYDVTLDSYTSYEPFQVKLNDAVYSTGEQVGESVNIDIEFYTYESNVTTSYGNKRLSVPYSMEMSSDLYTNALSSSSDGWYQVGVLDIPIWDSEIIYASGDVTYRDSIVYIALQVTMDSDPLEDTEESNWRPLVTSDLYNVVTVLNSDSSQYPQLRVLADIIITRRVKYTILYDMFRASDFNEFDDVSVINSINNVLALRERIKFHLHSYEPMKALEMFSEIEMEYNAYKTSSSDTTLTTGSTSLNNFTL